MPTRTKKMMPKGLVEFGASLADPQWSPELLPRLLDLPEHNFCMAVAEHKRAIKAVKEAEAALEAALSNATKIAQNAFRTALKNWTIKELQEATGYDDE